MRFSKFLVAVLVLAPQSALSDTQLAEVQRTLNAWQLDAGPEDGVWRPETEKALTAFLTHRGIEFGGAFGPEDYREVMGQTEFRLPLAEGLEFCQSDGFPSQDSYEISDTDPGMFSISLRKGDFDRTDYRNTNEIYDSTTQNFNRQRATVHSCEWLGPDQTYTLDFEVKVADLSVGTFFQILPEGDEGIELQGFPDSLRVNAGSAITMKAVYRGDWLGDWVTVRTVFRPDPGDRMFFRFFVNGKPGFDSTGQRTTFGFTSKGARLAFGAFRGNSSREGKASFRNIRLSSGDLGAPE